MGFYLRAGAWIDGVQILTSLGRKSEVFGNALGGSGYVADLLPSSQAYLTLVYRHTLIPPRGYSIAGIAGSCGAWVDGFSLIITR